MAGANEVFLLSRWGIWESALVALYKPAVVQSLGKVIASAGALNPPVEFQRDHERLLAYLDEQLETARTFPEVRSNTRTGGLGPPGPAGPPPGCVAQEEFSENSGGSFRCTSEPKISTARHALPAKRMGVSGSSYWLWAHP